MLEKNLRERYKLPDSSGEIERNQTGMIYCQEFKCHIHESKDKASSRLIFELPEYKGCSCFDIMSQ